MPKYYCDYCDTYLTHDSVSYIFFQYKKNIKKLNFNSHQLEKHIAKAENIKKMFVIITKSGWKNKHNV
jgi:hypothetical protein